MKNTKLIALIAMLLAAILCFGSCGTAEEPTSPATPDTDAAVVTEETKTSEITVIVKDADGNETELDVATDKTMLGEALVEKGLIEGTDSQYGMFVTTVNGIKIEDTNSYFWCVYKNGEMTETGVDTTPLADGDTFSFVYTKIEY